MNISSYNNLLDRIQEKTYLTAGTSQLGFLLFGIMPARLGVCSPNPIADVPAWSSGLIFGGSHGTSRNSPPVKYIPQAKDFVGPIRSITAKWSGHYFKHIS